MSKKIEFPREFNNISKLSINDVPKEIIEKAIKELNEEWGEGTYEFKDDSINSLTNRSIRKTKSTFFLYATIIISFIIFILILTKLI